MNWTGVWNRLWRMLDMPAPCYFSGPRFLAFIREANPDLPEYGELMETRRQRNLSTSRRDYFRDLFMDLDEGRRPGVVTAILDEIHACENLATEIRALLAGGAAGPVGNVPPELWNAERLNRLLADIDGAIAAAQYERAVTLAYTCLEGFYGAFFRANGTSRSASSLCAFQRRTTAEFEPRIGSSG